MRRVVITGMGLTTPIGHDVATVTTALRESAHGIVRKPEWAEVGQLETRLAGEVRGVDLSGWPRKKVRTMGRVSLLATWATERAVEGAKLGPELLASGRTGLAYGSTHGSSEALEAFCRTLFDQDSLRGIPSSAYLKFMSHTCAANLALFYGIRGPVIPTCAACVSGSQAIGIGFDAIRSGAQDVMICGGAEELHFVHAAVFDIMYATSTRYNDRPEASPRPFDVERDGLVIGEGAGTVVLESLEHAQARGATIHAEVLGWGTNCDGTHVTSPSTEGMADCMRLALDASKVAPSDIRYVNAHATATKVGDVCESVATSRVLGDQVPISSTKGATGHTLGACGAIEVIFSVAMMQNGFIAPTRNLDTIDPECAPLDYVRGEARRAKIDVAMTNNFAFGGINTSIVLARR